jgi:hypothetical protein
MKTETVSHVREYPRPEPLAPFPVSVAKGVSFPHLSTYFCRAGLRLRPDDELGTLNVVEGEPIRNGLIPPSEIHMGFESPLLVSPPCRLCALRAPSPRRAINSPTSWMPASGRG